MEAEVLHADRQDGQTDMTKLTVAFRNFPKAPTNASFHLGMIFARWTKERKLLTIKAYLLPSEVRTTYLCAM